ncbi:hypothetical protein P7H15_15590 [Paenibacillus larvae]|nr:hypothetical protein [Paenibacillus larvae]MDT2293949.1 hypothetical protein [Paenibacillus larvae]
MYVTIFAIITAIAAGIVIYVLYYETRNYRQFMKVMTESERRMREFDDECLKKYPFALRKDERE